MGFVHDMRSSGNALLTRAAAVAAIGGLLFGYDTGVASGAILFIKKELHADATAQEWIISVLLLGAMVGALAGGYLADRVSRKWTTFGAGVLYVVGAIGCAVSVSVPMLIGCRFVLGLAVGAASFVAPLYISEVSPPKVRGGLVSFNQLAVTSGILVSYIIDFLFQGVPGNWRWMLGLAVVPGIALALGMLTVPHTPRWLGQHGRDEEARGVLERLRSRDDDADIDGEMREIDDVAKAEGDTSVRDLLKPAVRPLLMIGLALAIFQQLVGVNTVIYYAPTILKSTGLTNSGSIAQTVFVGVTNVVFTAAAVLLLDRVGRRPLLLVGTAGLTVALALLAVYFLVPGIQHGAPWLALGALLLFIASFAIGLGPVFWLMIAEIFPMGVRSKAMSVSTVANWLANFVVAGTFLTVTHAITQQGTFFVYTGIGIVAFLFFAWKVPETKNRSLEDIQKELTGARGDREEAGRSAS